MRATSLGVCGGLALALALMVTVQAADSQVATWKLNLAKSTYSPGPAPKSGTLKIEAAGDGVKFTNNGVGADGKTTHSMYTATYDGKEFKAQMGTLPNGADTGSLKRIDAQTVETTFKGKGKLMVVARAVVSADGKTRTTTVTGTDADGKPVKNVIVYDRQ